MGMVKVTSRLIVAGSEHGLGFGVRVWREMKIWCVYAESSLK